MRIARHFLIGSVALVFFAQSVAAQNYQEWDSIRDSEVRGTVSITIPLGGQRKTSNSAPRLDFALQSNQAEVDDRTHANLLQPRRSLQLQSVMSFTLEQRPKLMLNGMRVASFGPQSLKADQDEDTNDGGGGNTALYVVGGVLLLGVAGTVALTTDIRDAASDLIGPAD